MSANIIRVSWLFHPVWGHVAEGTAHFERPGKCPLLIHVQHDQAVITDKFSQHISAPDISFGISRSYFQLERPKPFVQCLAGLVSNLLIVVAKPTYGSVVTGISRLQHMCPLRSCGH